MAGRKPIRGLRKVTLNLIGDSYDDIKRFSELSPAGITTNAFIREVIHQFGLYCRKKLDVDQVASADDFNEVKEFVELALTRGPQKEKLNAHD